MSKLDYLIRKNRREKEIVGYKKDLSRIFQMDFHNSDFIDLEESDAIIKSFFDAYKLSSKRISKVYSVSQEEHLEKEVDALLGNVKNEMGYLITSKSETCGVCKVAITKALKKYKDIIELDGDSLCILSMDKDKGIYIDFFEEYENDVSFLKYELAIWGWDL